MTDKVVPQGTVGGLDKFVKNVESGIVVSQHRGQFVSQMDPKYMEYARARVLYGANNGSAVGLDDVETIPTTAATYALYNGHASKSLVVLKIAATVTTVTSALSFGLMAGLSPTPQAAAETKYANSLALAITPGSPDPGGYLTDAATLAGTPLWMALANNQTGAGDLGASAIAWVDGLFIVPPRYALGIVILGSAGTTPKFDVDVLWAELSVDF